MGNIPFFLALFTALAVENTVFSRALGLNRPVLHLNRAKTGILYGAVFTWMVTASSMLASLVNALLPDETYARYVRSLLFLLCVVAMYLLSLLITRLVTPRLFGDMRRVLPLTTFNTALFGALYMSIRQDFLQSVGYALGTGLGYTFAILVLYYAQKRISISPVPRSFRGVPVLLIYIGILSLAIYGLIGHGLPT
jgi:electron transport complex protein RnfA